jgi:hypothetical protein
MGNIFKSILLFLLVLISKRLLANGFRFANYRNVPVSAYDVFSFSSCEAVSCPSTISWPHITLLMLRGYVFAMNCLLRLGKTGFSHSCYSVI